MKSKLRESGIDVFVCFYLVVLIFWRLTCFTVNIVILKPWAMLWAILLQYSMEMSHYSSDSILFNDKQNW